jgi:hypothetical protein
MFLLTDKYQGDEWDEEAQGIDGGGGEKYKMLVGKPEGKTPLGRHWSGWEDRLILQLMQRNDGMNFIYLATSEFDSGLLWTCPKKGENLVGILAIISFQ